LLSADIAELQTDGDVGAAGSATLGGAGDFDEKPAVHGGIGSVRWFEGWVACSYIE
jgi:hypothetical protein